MAKREDNSLLSGRFEISQKLIMVEQNFIISVMKEKKFNESMTYFRILLLSIPFKIGMRVRAIHNVGTNGSL